MASDIVDNRLMFALHCLSECKSLIESKKRGQYDPQWYMEMSKIGDELISGISKLEEKFVENYFIEHPKL